MRTAAAALAALALAAPLGAQEHRHGAPADTTVQATMCPAGMTMLMQGMDERMAAVMADVMRFEPRHVLAAGEVLDLTSAQVGQLEHLATAREEAQRGAGQRMNWTEVSDALDAQQPDTAAVRRAAERMLAHSSAMHVRMAVDAAAVKALLSPAQRAKVPAPKGCTMMVPDSSSAEGHHHDRP